MKTKSIKKVAPKVIPHDVRHGTCALCGRKDGELTNVSCPGYRTAAEIGSKVVKSSTNKAK
jgi:hypothetical protein